MMAVVGVCEVECSVFGLRVGVETAGDVPRDLPLHAVGAVGLVSRVGVAYSSRLYLNLSIFLGPMFVATCRNSRINCNGGVFSLL